MLAGHKGTSCLMGGWSPAQLQSRWGLAEGSEREKKDHAVGIELLHSFSNIIWLFPYCPSSQEHNAVSSTLTSALSLGGGYQMNRRQHNARSNSTDP